MRDVKPKILAQPARANSAVDSLPPINHVSNISAAITSITLVVRPQQDWLFS